jgi:hypothetical protein
MAHCEVRPPQPPNHAKMWITLNMGEWVEFRSLECDSKKYAALITKHVEGINNDEKRGTQFFTLSSLAHEPTQLCLVHSLRREVCLVRWCVPVTKAKLVYAVVFLMLIIVHTGADYVSNGTCF